MSLTSNLVWYILTHNRILSVNNLNFPLMVIWGQVHQIFNVLTEFLQKTYITHKFLVLFNIVGAWQPLVSIQFHCMEKSSINTLFLCSTEEKKSWKYTWVSKWWKMMKIKFYFFTVITSLWEADRNKWCYNHKDIWIKIWILDDGSACPWWWYEGEFIKSLLS